MFTLLYRGAYCVYARIDRVNVCVLYSIVWHCAWTVQYKEALCVYCTIQRDTVCTVD